MSPVSSALHGPEPAIAFNRAATICAPKDCADPVEPLGEPLPTEEFPALAGAELDIQEEFLRLLAGLRRLPRSARAAALREARCRRRLALKALHERRAALCRGRCRQYPPPQRRPALG